MPIYLSTLLDSNYRFFPKSAQVLKAQQPATTVAL